MKIRTVLCTSGGLFGAIVLRRLLASKHLDVVGVVLSSRVLRARYSWCRGAYEQLRTSGLTYSLYLWAATGLADLILRYTPVGSVSSQTAAQALPCLITRNVNDAAGGSFLSALAPDLLLSAFFNQRIEEPIYGIPTFGAINIHPSLLPDHRGVDPVFFARLQNQRQFGVTVHRVAATLDTGDILIQQRYRPGPGESVLRTTAELYGLGADLVAEQVREFIRPGMGYPQHGPGSYDSWPDARAIAAFRRQGGRLMRWQDIRALVRATARTDHAL